MRIFVTNDCTSTQTIFRDRGHEIVTDFNKGFDLIVFSGGADICPYLYGEKCLAATSPSLKRDQEEIKFWKALTPDFPKVGICRGAQLGNILCGGSLWQDVNNHYDGMHTIKLHKDNDAKIVVNTIHHQMCRLTSDADLLASASASTKKESDTRLVRYTLRENNWEDPEAFYYEKFNFLGVQFHPEYGHEPSHNIFFNWLEEYYP